MFVRIVSFCVAAVNIIILPCKMKLGKVCMLAFVLAFTSLHSHSLLHLQLKNMKVKQRP